MFFLGQILTRDLDSLAVPREADGLVRSIALLGSQLLAEASLLTPHLVTWRPCPHSFLCVAVTLISPAHSSPAPGGCLAPHQPESSCHSPFLPASIARVKIYLIRFL